jgi:predicted SnoaL-like aldol condensation-catalyzing enzyme
MAVKSHNGMCKIMTEVAPLCHPFVPSYASTIFRNLSANLSVKEVGYTGHAGMLVEKDFTCSDKYFGPPCLQHNPMLKSGIDGVATMMKAVLGDVDVHIHGVSCEGDIVFFHKNINGFAMSPDMFGVDFYRIRNGLIVEHWDIQEPAWGGIHSAHMVVGPTKVEDFDLTEENRELVRRFVKDVLIGKKFSQIDSLGAEDLVQHDPNIKGGRAGLAEFLQSGKMQWTRLGRILSEGNFVVSSYEGIVAPAYWQIWAFNDIYFPGLRREDCRALAG